MEQGRHRRAPPTGPAPRSPETSRTTSRPCQAAATPTPSTPWASVLLFIANKAIFDTITEADPDILRYALSQHVVICCPQTLMSVLLLVRNAANVFRVQRRTLDVIACIEGFQAQWRQFTKHLHTADKQLNTFCRTWETLNSTRRNQLQKQLDRIDELDVQHHPNHGSETDTTDTRAAADAGTSPHLPAVA